MSKKLKANGFIDGTMISYFSVIITKILGALYVIPFTAIVGTNGMVIYSCAYLIYNFVLNASTSGIPTAMSILISEYNTKGLHKTKMKVYRVGMTITVVTGFILFLLIEFFAADISDLYINKLANNSGTVSVDAVTNAVRAIGACLIVVPFLSIFRGFLQGQKVLAVSSYSQVIEQFARIAVVLFGAYLTVNVLDMGVSVGVNIALLGAGVGALLAIIYLKCKTRNGGDVIVTVSDETDLPNTWTVIKRFLAYSIPVFIVAISGNIYDIVDNVLVVFSLTKLGLKDSLLIGSIISTYGPKISMIVFSLSMGLTYSIVPAMSAHVAKQEYDKANQKLCSAMNIIFAISIPMSMGILLLSTPIYNLFYGTNGAEYGGFMLKFIIVLSVIASLKITLCMAMQGLKRTKMVCFATILGIVINAGLDVPLIFGLNYAGLGENCFIGAFVATFIGQTTCIIIILASLRRSLNFRYGTVLRTVMKILVPTIVMSLVVGLAQIVLPVPEVRGIKQILMLCIYGAVGGGIYLVLAYLNGALYEVFGKTEVDKILTKLHLKRKSV